MYFITFHHCGVSPLSGTHIWGCWVFYSRRCTKFSLCSHFEDIWPVDILSPLGKCPPEQDGSDRPRHPTEMLRCEPLCNPRSSCCGCSDPPPNRLSHSCEIKLLQDQTCRCTTHYFSFQIFFLLTPQKDNFTQTWRKKKKLSVTENKSRLWQIKVTSMSWE